MYQKGDEYYHQMAALVKGILDGEGEQVVVRRCKGENYGMIWVYVKAHGAFQDLDEYLGTNDEADDITSSFSRISDEMIKDLREQNKELWTELIFTVMKNGEYAAEYSYEEHDFKELLDIQEHINWKYRRLGVAPDEKKKHGLP